MVEVEPKSRTQAEPIKSESKLTSKSAPKAKGDKENDDEEQGSKGKTLKKGDKLPLITLEDEEGESVNVGELAKGRGVVIFVYPKVCPSLRLGHRSS